MLSNNKIFEKMSPNHLNYSIKLSPFLTTVTVRFEYVALACTSIYRHCLKHARPKIYNMYDSGRSYLL